MKRLALAACLLGCTSGQPPKTQATNEKPTAPVAIDVGRPEAGADDEAPSLSEKDARLITKTLTKVAKLRGIPPSRAVPGVKLGRLELVAKVKDKALREYPAEALARESRVLALLGFAPVGFDYLGATMKLLEAQLDGFYEPKNGTMYLAADLRGLEAHATLAHELVHALQDQRWDLRSRSGYRPGRGDETMALAALAEGDATSAMMDFALEGENKTALDMPEAQLRLLMQGAMETGETASVPHILRSTLIAPYLDGLAFVHGLRRGGGWVSVDRAWARPPKTTEQILHLDKWEKDERAIDVVAPTAAALGTGWKKDDEDSFGELGILLSLGEWMEADDARAAAAGWGGDRAAVFVKGDEIAFATHLRYDAGAPADAYARRAMAKASGGMKRTLGAAASSDSSSICFERRELGPLLVARRDRDVAILAGPADMKKSQSRSTSSCAVARKWADEILARP